ncbi:MAG: type II secretion system protein [bacterium]
MSIKAITNRIISFTLAEIMMVLVVVGVISALVIPATVQYFQDAHFKVSWKEAYSTLAAATDSIIAEGRSYPLGTLQNVFTDNNIIKDKYAQYLKHIKSCDAGQLLGNCWHNNGSGKSLNGTVKSDWGANQAGIILNNGILIKKWLDSSNCTAMTGTIPRCGGMAIDINGFNSPNTIGRDIFLLHILSNGIKPLGTQGDAYQNSCNSSSTGYSCSMEYLRK